MEDCSENLDDGELWLPSDIFPLLDEAVSVSFPPPPNKFPVNYPNSVSTCCCYRQADNEDILQRFAAFSLHHQRNHHHQTHFTERFRRCTCMDSSHFERKMGGELLHTGPPPPPPPVYPYQLYLPVLQHQVESLMEARTRALQMEENRFVQMHNILRNNRDLGSRFVQPFVRGGGYGGGGGRSSRRDYGGTGVFLPRVPNNTNTHNAATTLNNPHARKRQGGRNRQEVQHSGQRYPVFI